MTHDQIELQAQKSKEEIADADRGQREKESKRKSVDSAVAASAKMVGTIVGAGAKAANDPSWYDLDKQLTGDSCTANMAVQLGEQMNLGSEDSVPGIMVLRYVPTLSVKTADYFNTVANGLYCKITGNKSVTSFQASDLMVYLQAMNQVYSLINLAKRMYRIRNTFKNSSTNAYIGNVLNEYCGGSVPVGQLATFRGELNLAIQRANAFYVPANIPYFARHSQMNSNIYADSQYKKYSQLYCFVPSGSFIYNDAKGRLEYKAGPDIAMSNMTNYGYVLSELNNLLDALQGSSSISQINSKMEDYFTKHSDLPLITIQFITEQETIDIVYSEEILNQITNATINDQLISELATTSGGSAGKLMIYQDTSNPVLGTRLRMGYIDSNDTLVLGKLATNVRTDFLPLNGPAMTPVAHSTVLPTTEGKDLWNSEVMSIISEKYKVPAQMIVGTRLKTYLDSYNKMFACKVGTSVIGDTQVHLIANTGTEIITSAYVIRLKYNPNGVDITFVGPKVTLSINNVLAVATRMSKILANVMAFDHCPVIGIAYGSSGANESHFLNQDYHILITLEDSQLEKMNKVALQSQLALPIYLKAGK